MTRERLLKVDTHTHPTMSKMLELDPSGIVRMVRMARRVGLDVMALTEHLHARNYWSVYDHLTRDYRAHRGLFWADGLALLPGGEVNIREGCHIVVLGEVSELRRVDLAFPRPLSQGYEPSLGELLDATADLDVVRIGAHMFRPEKELAKVKDDDLRRLDALEVNGKDHGTEISLIWRARELGLPVVAGSDAHHWLQVGVRHTVMEVGETSMAGVLSAIRRGLTWYDASALTPVRVKVAKSVKTWAKRLTASTPRLVTPEGRPEDLATAS